MMAIAFKPSLPSSLHNSLHQSDHLNRSLGRGLVWIFGALQALIQSVAKSALGAWLLACSMLLAVPSSWAGDPTQLIQAAKMDDAKGVLDAMFFGQDPNEADENANSALHWAIKESSWKAAKLLIETRGVQVDNPNIHGETPLMLAALQGHVPTVELLIKRQARINRRGWTPLHYAASKGQIEVVRLLLQRGAMINTKAPNGLTAYQLAINLQQPSTAQVLRELGGR